MAAAQNMAKMVRAKERNKSVIGNPVLMRLVQQNQDNSGGVNKKGDPSRDCLRLLDIKRQQARAHKGLLPLPPLICWNSFVLVLHLQHKIGYSRRHYMNRWFIMPWLFKVT
jgi:hypothetical protein